MKVVFFKPRLNHDQKSRIKRLYERNNYKGFLPIAADVAWISAACTACIAGSYWFYLLSIAIIGTRQRAIASLLHEAAHGILFDSRWLNASVGRIVCGWPVLQSLKTYRISHVLTHHPYIGEQRDPDLQFMTQAGVYEQQTRARFLWRYLITPWFGALTAGYIIFLLKDRFGMALREPGQRLEACALLLGHIALLFCAYHFGWLLDLVLLWWVPFLVVHPIVSWFSELAEHFPMMDVAGARAVFYSRNRYAAWPERFFIGMHGDHLHLTHHLLPGIPHWNLAAATEILREDPAFCEWDKAWGGILTTQSPERMSLLKYIVNIHEFTPVFRRPILQLRGAQ